MTRTRFHRRLAVALGLTSAVLLAGAAIVAGSPPPPPPPQAVLVSREQAMAAVGAFGVEGTMDVSGPAQGAYHQAWLVDGAGFTAMVDAYTGTVSAFQVRAAVPTSPTVVLVPEDAEAAAEAYLETHGISVAGLEAAVALEDHGGTVEYRVAWERRIHGALVPDRRLVSVNAETGEVFGLVNISYPYEEPPPPKVDENQARSKALALVGDAGASVTSTDLLVRFDAAGSQILVWQVAVEGGGQPRSATMVHVDSMTGAAVIMGRG